MSSSSRNKWAAQHQRGEYLWQPGPGCFLVYYYNGKTMCRELVGVTDTKAGAARMVADMAARK